MSSYYDEARETMSRSELRALQESLLRELLPHAYEHSPLTMGRLGLQNARTEFRRISVEPGASTTFSLFASNSLGMRLATAVSGILLFIG